MALGNRLKQLLDERNITVKDFAKKIGVPATTLYSFIKRDSKNAKVDLLMKICDGLDIKLGELLTTQENNDESNGDFWDFTCFDDEEQALLAFKEMLVQGLDELKDVKKKDPLTGEIITLSSDVSIQFDTKEYSREELRKIKEYAEFLKSQRNK